LYKDVAERLSRPRNLPVRRVIETRPWFGRETKTWLLTEYDTEPPASERILDGSGNPVSGTSWPTSPLTDDSTSTIPEDEASSKVKKPFGSERGSFSQRPKMKPLTAGNLARQLALNPFHD
jgi:hypothetical protein